GNGTSGNETWALSLARGPSWSMLEPAGPAPPARSGHAAVYDPLRRRMLMFGGRTDAAQPVRDAWALSLSDVPAWTELNPAGTPPPVSVGLVAWYDRAGDRVLVYAGNTGEEGGRDVWSLSLSGTPNWTQLHLPGPVPDDAVLPALVDTKRDRLVVFNYSGFCEGFIPQFPTPECDGMWALGPSAEPSWSLLSPASPPPIPRSHVPLYDSADDQVVVVASDF